MKTPAIMVWVLLGFLLALSPVSASEDAAVFLDGLKAYRSGDYEKAVADFSKLTDAGLQNGKLYYNLANAHLKQGNLGNAILWYEKALKLIPDDPDLKFNYAHALTLTKDEKSQNTAPLMKILFFWKYRLSRKVIQHTAIALNALFWICLLLHFIYKKALLKTAVYLLLAGTLMFTATALFNYHEDINLRQGVVLSSQVSVRSGLTDAATELFKLHSGTRVDIEKESGDHYRISFSEGKIGWVRKQDLGVI